LFVFLIVDLMVVRSDWRHPPVVTAEIVTERAVRTIRVAQGARRPGQFGLLRRTDEVEQHGVLLQPALASAPVFVDSIELWEALGEGGPAEARVERTPKGVLRSVELRGARWELGAPGRREWGVVAFFGVLTAAAVAGAWIGMTLWYDR
jgi:hypothetical protein